MSTFRLPVLHRKRQRVCHAKKGSFSVHPISLRRYLQPNSTKNGAGRIIPLTLEVLSSLEMQKARTGQFCSEAEWVFCDDSGKPMKDLSWAWRIACRKAGFVDEADKPTKLLHDCSRSAVRNMVRSGTSEKICMAISGHKTRSIFDRYDIVSERDLIAAARRLSNHINGSDPIPDKSSVTVS